MVDFFDKIYSFRSSNNFLSKIRFFSGLRLITKLIANLVVPIFYSMTRDFSYTLNNSVRKSNNRVIVSLTTFPNRIDRIWIVIESIFRQSFKPDLIILWLSKDQFNSIEELPKKLLKQQKKGLKIILCDNDLKSHKKYFYAFKEYLDDVIVTFDDDVLYSSIVLKNLLILHEKFPKSICCNVGHRVAIGNDGILPYSRWEQLNSFSGPSYNISFIGVGGVLYPPFSLHKDVFNNDVFEKVCMNADDIWLKAMSLLKKTTVVKSDYYSNYLPIIHLNNKTLSASNLSLCENDKQLNDLRMYYIQESGVDPFSQIIS